MLELTVTCPKGAPSGQKDTVTGDEHLLVQEALDAIRLAAREQGFGERELYTATTGFDWGDLAGAGGNLSLFADRRIIELRLPTGKPGVKGSATIVDIIPPTIGTARARMVRRRPRGVCITPSVVQVLGVGLQAKPR